MVNFCGVAESGYSPFQGSEVQWSAPHPTVPHIPVPHSIEKRYMKKVQDELR
jgi:hypothetical protein